MIPPDRKRQTFGAALVALMLLQGVCAFFFVSDLTHDLWSEGWAGLRDSHTALEILANTGLIAGLVFEGIYLAGLLRRQAMTDRALSVASGALGDVIQGYFQSWGLTPSEADVALFTIKGFSIAEVARMRGSAEGTVKTHLNAVYRKAGIAGRGQLVSLLIEDLMAGGLGGSGTGRAEADGSPEASRQGAHLSSVTPPDARSAGGGSSAPVRVRAG